MQNATGDLAAIAVSQTADDHTQSYKPMMPLLVPARFDTVALTKSKQDSCSSVGSTFVLRRCFEVSRRILGCVVICAV